MINKFGHVGIESKEEDKVLEKEKKEITLSKEEIDKIIDISVKIACILYIFSKIIEEINLNEINNK